MSVQGATAAPVSAPADQYPLSFGQQALWFVSKVLGGAIYHVPRAYRLVGELRCDHLRAALSAAMDRHAILRTAYPEAHGMPFQAVSPSIDLDLPVFDLTGLEETRRQETAASVLRDQIRAEFDLAAGPVLRASLIRLGASEHIFSLVIHHIATDGWSLRLLAEELSQAYQAQSAGTELNQIWPELPIQFADYSVWQRQWLSGACLDSRLEYWKAALADLPDLHLAGQRERPSRPSFQTDRVFAVIARDTCSTLRAQARLARTSLFATLAATFAVVLNRCSGQPDIAFGTMLSGRIEPELELLHGYFANMIVLRVDLADDPPFQEIARRLNRGIVTAIDQEAPFAAVVAKLAPPRIRGRNPLFQIGMQLLDDKSGPGTLEFPAVTALPLDVHQGQQALDLMLSFVESDVGLRVLLEYSTELFDAPCAARFADLLVRVSTHAAADPGARMSEILCDNHRDRAGG